MLVTLTQTTYFFIFLLTLPNTFFCRFQCIQACDYDETKLVTGENLVRHRKKKFAHLSLKHITLLGVVRLKQKKRKSKKTREKKKLTTSQPVRGRCAFLFDEAAVNESDNDDDEEENDEDDVDGQSENERQQQHERGMSESEFDSDSESDRDEEEEVETPGGDLSEQIVVRTERQQRDLELSLAHSDHAYSCVREFGGASYSDNRTLKQMNSREWRKKAKYRYSFLYAISASGVTKKIKNCIPKAVAILSNSKTIILGHVNVMLECLDPALAELCYMDTDSCLFSFTHANLEDNLLEEKKEVWRAADILADEAGPDSCHGKLKLEGTFRVGFFKALKIYRLFSSRDFQAEYATKTCYTRCKGVNRNIAKIIPNAVFDRGSVDKTVVHRSCLRPSRTGEMLIAHECRSLAAPFNLKRHVTYDGLHSFPVSYVVADEDGGGDVDEDDHDNDGGGSGSRQRHSQARSGDGEAREIL